jgi:Tfp pilus assembly protein PilF
MLHSFFSIFFILVFSFMLASCAGIDNKAQDIYAPVESTGLQKFPAWELEGSLASPTNTNRAVMELLKQADELIANNQMEQASDKLERLLRIEPTYAQAWSRLAWIALENNQPKRTQQMSQRSNSYASGNKRLKALNWSFIRESGQRTGDEAVIVNAEKMIESLGGL